ncbi:hypothetical protein LINGRAHAP2_LOCUS23401 [Linum grandiflorum]
MEVALLRGLSYEQLLTTFILLGIWDSRELIYKSTRQW